jgi:uncharacterized protein (TIGR02284 family)
MSETACFLHDLIQISRDGTEFYEEAARSVSDKKLSRVFIDMAKAKTELADNLSSEIKPRAKGVLRPMDLVGEVGQTYAGIGRAPKSVNSANITALEQSETHIQGSLQKVVMDRDNSFVIRVLAKQYVHKAEALKAELRSRKRSLG